MVLAEFLAGMIIETSFNKSSVDSCFLGIKDAYHNLVFSLHFPYGQSLIPLSDHIFVVSIPIKMKYSNCGSNIC
jgi:hypothetical protein